MAADAINVTAAKPKKGGAVSSGPVGTKLPTDTATELDVKLKSLGYISDDGMTNEDKRESEEIKAWGGDVVQNSQTSKVDTFKFKLIEALNVDVLKEVYGEENVTGSLKQGIKITVNSKELTSRSWVIDMLMNNGVAKRMVIPNGKITETSEIVYKDGEVVGYEVTITAYPDSDENTHYEYIKGA